MRATLLFAITILGVSCASGETKVRIPSSSQSEAEASAEASFREHCEAFESMDFGTKTAAVLRGRIWLSAGAERQPLAGVQIAAREPGTGEFRHVLTSDDGRFQVDSLVAGEYDVWTCLDGFDEVRFRLVLDPASTARWVDVYLGPSEALGRRDVVVGFDSPSRNQNR